MEIDTVSFKIVLGGTSLFNWFIIPSRKPGQVLSSEQRMQRRDSSWWIHGRISEEIRSVLRRLCGQHFDLDRKMELEVLPPLDHSLAHVRYPGEHVLSGRQRGSWVISKKRQKRSGQALLVYFRCAASQCTCWKWDCLVSWMVSKIPMANASDDHHIFVFPLCSAVFIFRWFVCFFALSHWFSRKVGRET